MRRIVRCCRSHAGASPGGWGYAALDSTRAHGPVASRMRTGKALPVLALLLLALWPPAASAESPTPPSASPSVMELEHLVDTLRDDKARAAFVIQLQTLIAAERAVTIKAVEPEDLVSALSHRINSLAEEVLAGAAVVVDAPLLVAWVQGEIANEATRARWIQVAFALVIVFGVALIAEWVARRLLARVLPRAPTLSSNRATVLLVAAGAVLEALPVAAFAGAALTALAMTIPPFAMARYALSGLVEATIAVRLILAIARAVLVPAYVEDSILPASEETRNYLLIWVRRFTCWGIFGYAVAAAGWWLGFPGGIYALMLKLTAIVLAILGIVFVLQNRALLTRWIQGADPMGSAGSIRLRRRLGEIWHVLA